MKFPIKPIIFVVLLSLSFYICFPKNQGRAEEIQDKINEYEQMIKKLQGQEGSLNNEIKYLSAQVSYNELKIQETVRQISEKENEIISLEGDIENLQGRLEKLNSALEVEEKIVKARMREKYKKENDITMSPFLILAGSENLAELVGKLKYLRLLEQQDKLILSQMNLTKTSFEGQKNLLTNKKDKIGLLKTEIEKQKQAVTSYKAVLEDKKKTKQLVLEETQNDEAKYQELLRAALAESAALNAAVGKGVKDGPVSKGDPIALFGNSGYPGCSTGAHLHFEIRKNNQWVDPENYLEEKTVNDATAGVNTNMGNGDWEWPLKSPIILTQNYGRTPYSWRYKYSGGIHTGFDMVSNTSTVITAPADGVLYSTTEACGSSTIKIKYIIHDDDTVSYYLHVQ